MSRPGPLKDLQLDLFLPGNSNLPISGPFDTNSNNKRPLSPSSAIPHYAKRRLLNSEGPYGSPISVKAVSRFAEPVDFSKVLSGADSPARKLDFGAARSSTTSNAMEDEDIHATPRAQRGSSSRLAQLTPSPELSLKRTVPKPGSSSTKERNAEPPKPVVSYDPQWSHPLVFELVPRELPPLPDPTSEHFPGFVIYRDPHTVSARRDQTRTIEPPVSFDGDFIKENTAPPRIAHSLTSFLDSVGTDFPMSVGKGKGVIKGSHSPYSHKRIFATYGDDALDLSGSQDFGRVAALTSDLLDDEAKRPRGSSLWQG